MNFVGHVFKVLGRTLDLMDLKNPELCLVHMRVWHARMCVEGEGCCSQIDFSLLLSQPESLSWSQVLCHFATLME